VLNLVVPESLSALRLHTLERR